MTETEKKDFREAFVKALEESAEIAMNEIYEKLKNPPYMRLEFSFTRNNDKFFLNYLGSGDTYRDLFVAFEGTAGMLNDLVQSGYNESKLLDYANKYILEAYKRHKLKSEKKQ